jgi:NADPH-dependent glutamate synthase beta subunit-like oxidoreductase
VTQFELMPQPPESENRAMTWPYWPTKLRTSSSHEEGCERDWSVTTKAFKGVNGRVTALECARVEWVQDPISRRQVMREVEGSAFEIPADLVLFAMGFVAPVGRVLESFGVDQDDRGNARASTEGAASYLTRVPKVFAAGDMRARPVPGGAGRSGRAASARVQWINFSWVIRHCRADRVPDGLRTGSRMGSRIRVAQRPALMVQR